MIKRTFQSYVMKEALLLLKEKIRGKCFCDCSHRPQPVSRLDYYFLFGTESKKEKPRQKVPRAASDTRKTTSELLRLGPLASASRRGEKIQKREPRQITTMTRKLFFVLIAFIYLYFSSALVVPGSEAHTSTNEENDTLPVRYEAEDAPNLYKVTKATAHGTTFAYYNGQDAFAEWFVPIARSGIFNVTIRYANGTPSNQPMDLYIICSPSGAHSSSVSNTAEQPSAQLLATFALQTTTSWNIWNSETRIVEIGAGVRRIRLTATNSAGCDVDFLELTKLNHLVGYNSHGVYQGNNPWHIGRVGDITAKFDTEGLPEMILQYEVHKKIGLDQVKVSVNYLDCVTPVDGGISSVGTSFITTGNLTGENFTEKPAHLDLKIVTVQVDFDETSLVTSNIWTGAPTDGAIMMCIRVALVSNEGDGNDALEPQQQTLSQPTLPDKSYLETILLQQVELSSQFELEPLGVVQVVDELVDTTADVRFPVYSCVCDANFVCLEHPEPFHVNSKLHLCVFSKSEKVQIRRITEMTLEQEDVTNMGWNEFRAIERANNHPLTQVEIIYDPDNERGDFASIQTRLVTMFFRQKEPQDIIVRGEVAFAFLMDKEERELSSFRQHRNFPSNNIRRETYLERHENFETTIEVQQSSSSTGRAKITQYYVRRMALSIGLIAFIIIA